MEAVTTALEEGKGALIVLLDGEEFNLSEENACPVCEINLPKLEPQLFNFNSVLGMCSECDGLGLKLQVDPDLIVSKPHKSLLDDASDFYHLSNLRKSSSQYWISYFQSLAEHFDGPNQNFFVVPHGVHAWPSPYPGGDSCMRRLFLDFLADPEAALDDCTDDVFALSFDQDQLAPEFFGTDDLWDN